MNRLLRGILLVLAICLLVTWATWNWALTTPASRAVSQELLQWRNQTQHQGGALAIRFQIAETEGKLPKELTGRTGALYWQAPDRLRVQLEYEGEHLLAGLVENRAWLKIPEKNFGIVGTPEAPRFTGFPDSVEPVELPELNLPVSAWDGVILPMILQASQDPTGMWRVKPNARGIKAGLPEFELVAEPGKSPDRALSGLKIVLPDGKALRLSFEEFRVLPHTTPDFWEPPAVPGGEMEMVALSHLVKGFKTMTSLIGAKPPVLPPAQGKLTRLGASGEGRLESHDGVRVLFLKGTAAEMGRQHGELLREDVRKLNERLLYGLGVTKTLATGRWFFGEIESAQARLEPFTRPEYLAEMDALAATVGLHRQEVRLGNFFPELFHCSGFALHGKATIDGQMYHGRVLDYLRGVGLEERAVVMICRPDGANAWVNVGYAGFTGAVTAMNEKHLAIGEMGGRGEGNWDGKAMAQLVREVMEQCDTVEEAVELMRTSPRTCEYFYVISDAKSMRAVGIRATPEIFETVWDGETHPLLPEAVEDAVMLSAGDRYTELVRRVRDGYGKFDADRARDLMTTPVCMTSNIQSVLFAPGTLDFWVANADGENVASHTRYTKFNLGALLRDPES